MHHDFYNQLINKKISIDEFQSEFKKGIDITNLTQRDKSVIIQLEAYLVYLSYHFLQPHRSKNLIDYTQNGKVYNVFSKIDSGSQEFQNLIEGLVSEYSHELDIDYLIKRVELLEAVRFIQD